MKIFIMAYVLTALAALVFKWIGGEVTWDILTFTLLSFYIIVKESKYE